MSTNKKASLGAHALVWSSYILALLAAWGTLRLLPDAHPLVRVAVADVVATVVVFAFSRAFDNSSFYDAYWSIAPMAIAPYLAFGQYETDGISVRKWLALLVVYAWGARLTSNWLRNWEGLKHEDWRYIVFRKQWGKAYWPLCFLAIHFFPTVCTYLGSLPLFVAMSSERPLGVLDIVGVVVGLSGAIIEGIADEQLRAYTAKKQQAPDEAKGGVCEVGLWRWSRHPNYFGECTFWVGLWIIALAADPSRAWWAASGAVLIILMFVFGTIPMAEKRALARRPEFAEYQRKVSVLVPWFRKS